MAKLFPPIIDITIPAFYQEDNNIVVSVPFVMNRAVSQFEVKGLVLKVKAVQSSTYLFEEKIENIVLNNNTNIANFIIQSSNKEYLKIGQYYKFQLAYISQNNEVGYYSTVGIGKYTLKPVVTIEGLKEDQSNSLKAEYMGVCNFSDFTEKVQNYIFNIYNSANELVLTSGSKIHNNQNDTELGQSIDIFKLDKEFNDSETYYIQYTIITINNLTLSSPKYKITKKPSIRLNYDIQLIAESNEEDGYVKIQIKSENNDNITDSFVLSRSSSETEYKFWEEISRFNIKNQDINLFEFKDFMIEQGKIYKYSVKQYNSNGVYSETVESNEVFANFEDAFLFDGKRQLKIRFNPKINNFKTTLLENKVETIGSQYPFILRNGNVNYKEFQIQGLISILIDDNHLFLPLNNNEEENGIQGQIYSDSNVKNEREFKLEVLDWLNNSEVKLFRSPTEGNYFVRLVNVSLTPLDQLGRLLHSFSCTAYEVEKISHDNMVSMGFINQEEPEEVYVNKIKVKNLGHSGLINKEPTNIIDLYGLIPGMYFYIVTDNGIDTSDQEALEPYKVMIGLTGNYYCESDDYNLRLVVPDELFNNSNNSIYNYDKFLPNVQFVYEYKAKETSNISDIIDYTVIEKPVVQVIGECDLIEKIGKFSYNNKFVENPKRDITNMKVFYIQVEKRPIIQIEKEQLQDTDSLKPDGTYLYAIGKYLDNLKSNFEVQEYYDPIAQKSYEIDKYDCNFSFKTTNDEFETEIDLTVGKNYFNDKIIDSLKSLRCGCGLVLYIGYQYGEKVYGAENDEDIYNLKQNYEQNPTDENYNSFICALYEKLQEDKN